MTREELQSALQPLVGTLSSLVSEVRHLNVTLEEAMRLRPSTINQVEGIANHLASRIHSLGDVIHDANEIARKK